MKTTTPKTRKSWLLFIVAIAAPMLALSQSKSDETLIQNIINEETTAWNTGDAKLYSNHFAKDGTFTNLLGQFYTGHQAFEERHDAIFKSIFKDTKLTTNLVSLRFIKPDVAIVETLAWVSGIATPPPGAKLDSKGRLVARLLQVMMKDGSDWKIEAYHNIDVKPGPPTPEPR